MKHSNSIIIKIIAFQLAFFTVLSTISCERAQSRNDAITKKDIELMKENHIIPLKEAIKMYDKYSKDRIKVLKDTLKKKYGNDFNDTRTVWFDIKTIRAYLKYLDENSKDIEGLQFYFSVNLDDKGKQKNHQTFFVAPTVKNVIRGDTIQSGYTIMDGKRIFLYQAFKEYLKIPDANMQKASFFGIMQDDDGFLLNGGDDSPPGGNN